MVHRVEEFRQVEVHYPDVALVRDFECFVDRGLTAPVRSKAVAVRAEYGFVLFTELLRYRLLNDSIDSSWNTQRSEFAFLLLRDHDSAYGLGSVFPCLHGLHYLDGVRAQVVQEIINGHAVDSWAAFVRLDLLIGAVQVIAFKDGF